MNYLNPHAVLGLAPGASAREIKHAFRRLAMRWHPDRNADPAALEHFKLLRAAHDLLLDGAEPPAASSAEEADATAPRAPRGEDRRETIELTIEEAYAGGEKTIALVDEVVCDECDGSGAQALRHTRLCAACHGTGRTRGASGLVRCGHCDGRGYVSRQSCRGCGGSGHRRSSRPLNVRIPPGMLDGDELRIAGEGEASDDAEGAPGDLVLRIVLAPHPLYRLAGRDLLLSRPISAIRMLVGGAVPIPLPGGVRHLKVQAGRAAPREMRVRGAGFPGRRGEAAGALIVQLVPVLPQAIDPALLPLLEQLEARLADALPRHLPDVASWEERWLPGADGPR